MSIESVREYLAQFHRDGDIIEFSQSTATVELAARALGTLPERIAKSISLYDGDAALLVVAAGDAKIDNKKFKDRFGFKAKMLSGEDVPRLTGHGVGGVCPFALPESCTVYLDESLRRFDTVYPACGSSNSCIQLTLPQLEQLAKAKEWIDVTKLPE